MCVVYCSPLLYSRFEAYIRPSSLTIIIGPSIPTIIGVLTMLPKVQCVHTLNKLAIPRVIHFGEIALAGSRRLRSTLAAAPVLFAHGMLL